MSAYWDAVWQIAGILFVFGVCLAVGGMLVIGVWIGVRRLSGYRTNPRGVLGAGSAVTPGPRVRPARAASTAGAAPQSASAAGAVAPAELPPPDSMGHTPKSALAERSASTTPSR